MLEQLLQPIDPFRWAAQGFSWQSEIALSYFERLACYLSNTSAKINVCLRFDKDLQGIYFIEGQVTGILTLQCQRCMENMLYPVDAEFRLALFESEQAADAAALESYESIVVEERQLVSLDIIEDELILSLPVVALHPLKECTVPAYDSSDEVDFQAEKRPNPFAVLESLKKKNT